MVVAEVCSSMKYPKRCQYKHAKQKKYHVRNWAEYNEGLRRRGDLTVWFDEEAIANWKADKTGKPGGQRVYSDMAIETGLVVRMVYKLAYRQTEGFLHSIASLLGLGIEIPDYSTLCRRSRLLRKKLRIPKAASTQPIHLMIDSTGLRIHVGNARKPPKQRAWRKLHIAVDRETGNIVASELTASRARDATRVPALLTQIQAPLVSVAADSAYDKEAVYEAIEAHSPGRRTRVVIPPQRNATLSQNSNTAMQERDRHIRAIERHGRREWYKLSGYTKRSMVENAVYRYKAIIGPEMRARTLARQRVEHRIGCEILNKMAALGMPDTVLRRVTQQPAQGGQRFAPGRATTPLDTQRAEVTVEGVQPEAVVQDHGFAEKEEVLGQCDAAPRRSQDRRSRRSGEIFPAMRASGLVVKDSSLAEASRGLTPGNRRLEAPLPQSLPGRRGVVAPLWLRAKSAYGGGRGMFEHEVSQALPVQAREAEEVPRSQLGGIQRRAAPSGRFDSLV